MPRLCPRLFAAVVRSNATLAFSAERPGHWVDGASYVASKEATRSGHHHARRSFGHGVHRGHGISLPEAAGRSLFARDKIRSCSVEGAIHGRRSHVANAPANGR